MTPALGNGHHLHTGEFTPLPRQAPSLRGKQPGQHRNPAVPRHPRPPAPAQSLPAARRTPLLTGQVLGRGFLQPEDAMGGEGAPLPREDLAEGTIHGGPSPRGWRVRNDRSFPRRRARGPSHPRHGLVILGTVWGWQLVLGWVTAEHGLHLGSARPLLAHLFPTL